MSLSWDHKNVGIRFLEFQKKKKEEESRLLYIVKLQDLKQVIEVIHNLGDFPGHQGCTKTP